MTSSKKAPTTDIAAASTTPAASPAIVAEPPAALPVVKKAAEAAPAVTLAIAASAVTPVPTAAPAIVPAGDDDDDSIVTVAPDFVDDDLTPHELAYQKELKHLGDIKKPDAKEGDKTPWKYPAVRHYNVEAIRIFYSQGLSVKGIQLILDQQFARAPIAYCNFSSSEAAASLANKISKIEADIKIAEPIAAKKRSALNARAKKIKKRTPEEIAAIPEEFRGDIIALLESLKDLEAEVSEKESTIARAKEDSRILSAEKSKEKADFSLMPAAIAEAARITEAQYLTQCLIGNYRWPDQLTMSRVFNPEVMKALVTERIAGEERAIARLEKL